MTNVRDTIKLETEIRELQKYNNELQRIINSLHRDVGYNLDMIESLQDKSKKWDNYWNRPAIIHTKGCACKDCRDVNDT